MDKIIDRKEGFTQVCVWPGCVVGSGMEATFERFMQEEFGVRVQFLEEVLTKPDFEGPLMDEPVPDTGGRNDLIFAVHEDDVDKFALSRLRAGIRWIEDVLEKTNNSRHMYDCERLDQYKNW